MKNKFLISGFFLLALAFSVIGVHYSSHAKISGFASDNDTIWHHYSKVENTISTKGIQEYWISCSSHEILFSKPNVEQSQIVDMGTPSNEFINALEDSDLRLIPAGGLLISFENDDDIQYIPNGNRTCVASREIIEDKSATHLNKVLKLTTFNSKTFSCTFLSSYLEKAFSDPSIVAVNFDLKANFEANKLSYANTTIAPYEYNCSSDNQLGYGLSKNWKTFSLTREMYNQKLDDNGNLICTVGDQAPIGGVIYIDNIRPVNEYLTPFGFECSRMVPKNDGYFNRTLSYRYFDNSECLSILTDNDVDEIDYGFDYDILNEGNRSIYYHRKGNKTCKVSLPGLIDKENLKQGDCVCFDLYTSMALDSNIKDASILDGKGNPFMDDETYKHPAQTWIRYQFSYDQIDLDNGNILFYFMGSSDVIFHLDHIQIIHC